MGHLLVSILDWLDCKMDLRENIQVMLVNTLVRLGSSQDCCMVNILDYLKTIDNFVVSARKLDSTRDCSHSWERSHCHQMELEKRLLQQKVSFHLQETMGSLLEWQPHLASRVSSLQGSPH